MTSTKKRQKKKCLKCGTLLSSKNWASYDQEKRYYVCKLCRKISDEHYHQADLNYAKKQKNRYHMRRSAVILAYGNACITCGEDDYSKLTINGNINYLYDNIIITNGHQVVCYNCSKRPYKNKYIEQYKRETIQTFGGYCQQCPEEHIERLSITNDSVLLCYNCKMSKLYLEKHSEEPIIAG